MNIYVSNLDYSTTSEDLQAAFEQFGTVDSAKIIMDRDTGRSKCFGFVEMSYDDEAYAAINDLNDSEMDGQTISVQKAVPREKRESGDYPPRNHPPHNYPSRD